MQYWRDRRGPLLAISADRRATLTPRSAATVSDDGRGLIRPDKVATFDNDEPPFRATILLCGRLATPAGQNT